jgi:hypothetical protein
MAYFKVVDDEFHSTMSRFPWTLMNLWVCGIEVCKACLVSHMETTCGEWIMRSLYKHSCLLAWPQPQKSAGCSAAAFPKLFRFREARMQVSLVTMSCLSLRTVAPPPVYHWI